MVNLPTQHPFGTTLRFTGHVPAESRQYVCMYVCMVITYSRAWINRARLPILLVNREKSIFACPSIFPCPRTRLKIWSRKTGSAVPSSVSLLVLHTQAESSAYSRDSSRFPRRRPFIYLNGHTPSGQSRVHRVTCVPMAFTAESLPAEGQ